MKKVIGKDLVLEKLLFERVDIRLPVFFAKTKAKPKLNLKPSVLAKVRQHRTDVDRFAVSQTIKLRDMDSDVTEDSSVGVTIAVTAFVRVMRTGLGRARKKALIADVVTPYILDRSFAYLSPIFRNSLLKEFTPPQIKRMKRKK
jgi:hypothetical protein